MLQRAYGQLTFAQLTFAQLTFAQLTFAQLTSARLTSAQLTPNAGLRPGLDSRLRGNDEIEIDVPDSDEAEFPPAR